MKKTRVLFVCVHNSARSQMAEAFLKHHGRERFDVTSAGIESGSLNPLAVEVMAEVGIDISGNQTTAVLDLFRRGELFQYVVTVCDAGSAERCPVFPGPVRRLHWNFPDPASFTGSKAEKLDQTRVVRDQIEKRVLQWIEELDS